MVGIEPVGGAEEMPSRWHEIVGVVEQITSCGEIVSIRRAPNESVEGHDLDVGSRACCSSAQAGLGAGVAVLGVHRGVQARCEGGPVAPAR